MKIVILGAGKTGAYVASALSQEKHDVVLIDSNPELLEQASREIDVATVLSSMPNLGTLETIFEMKPDLFFAATGNDELNLVSCSLSKNLGFAKTIAKVKSRTYLHSESISIGRLFYVDHFISPELRCAQDLFKLLTHLGDADYRHFAHGNILMRTVKIPDHWNQSHVPIKEMRLPKGLIAGLIRRKDQILFPHGEDVIQAGDLATLIGETKIMNELHHLFAIAERKIKSVIIVGGSEIAIHLSHLLLKQHIAVKIIEKSKDRCKELADLLPNATIIHRDGSDFAALREENIAMSDALVSCTEEEGTDYLISSMAKLLGCPKSISLVGNPASIPLFEKADVIPALASHVNVVNQILSINAAVTVDSLSHDEAKIVELKLSPSSKLIGKPIADLNLPEDFLIATIENHGKVMIGNGSSILCPDDTIVAICSPHRLEQLHHLFT
jgi:trk system potassium uptake protein TrkA